MAKPISPDEVIELKTSSIPDAVLEVFNGLIAKGWDGNRSTVYQDDVVASLEAQGFNRSEVYNNKWLDVEPIYEGAGWSVFYDKPVGYAGESFRAYFKFTKKGAKR